MHTPPQQSNAFDETGFGSEDRTDAPAPPERPNEGGASVALEVSEASPQSDTPRLVIRGESLEDQESLNDGESYKRYTDGHGHLTIIATPLPKTDGEPYAAITDYLNCTFPLNSKELVPFFSKLFDCLGREFAPATDRNRGLHGWHNSFALGNSSAFFAIGGQNGTGFLSLSGEACHRVSDWMALTEFLRDRLGARITRWDGAVDDYAGAHSVNWAVELYLSDKFNAGGNRPTHDTKGSWIQPDGRGRTFYVGKRENGKMARIYEKGMQLGAKWHPWVRWEVEMHNTDRIIPWEVLLEPGKYVAGAYPKALGWVQEEMQRIKTIRETTKISYEHLTHCAGVAYGKLINVMLEVEGSEQKVIEKLLRHGIPSRLDLPVIPQGEGRPK